jgi:hypothetical protein
MKLSRGSRYTYIYRYRKRLVISCHQQATYIYMVGLSRMRCAYGLPDLIYSECTLYWQTELFELVGWLNCEYELRHGVRVQRYRPAAAGLLHCTLCSDNECKCNIISMDHNGTEISWTEPHYFLYFIWLNSYFCVRLYRFRFRFRIPNVKVENGLDIFRLFLAFFFTFLLLIQNILNSKFGLNQIWLPIITV